MRREQRALDSPRAATSHTVLRVKLDEPGSEASLACAVASLTSWDAVLSSGLVLVCIGTDRSTGDALGPLTGSLLVEKAPPHLHVYGTLSQPVHATNLEASLDRIEKRHPGAAVAAIDACLGRSESVGTIAVRTGPLHPGTGVHKRLPSVGDFHMTGVVNVGGFMEYFVLQNTRLHLVMQMAQALSDGVRLAMKRLDRLPAYTDAGPLGASGALEASPALEDWPGTVTP